MSTGLILLCGSIALLVVTVTGLLFRVEDVRFWLVLIVAQVVWPVFMTALLILYPKS